MFSIIFQKLKLKLTREQDIEDLKKIGLKVGKNFNKQGRVIIDPSHAWLITIGDNVTMAYGVYVLAHDASTKMHTGYTKIGKVIIGNNVFIGANTTILPNVIIGDDVVIGTGSIVTRDVPNNSVVAGNPAKILAKTNEYVIKNKIMIDSGTSPVYGKEYTINNITNEQKKEMCDSLKNGIGFID